jgi:hypothetical protein
MMILLLGVVVLLIAVLAYDGWNVGRSRWAARRTRQRPVAKSVPVVDRRQRRDGGRRRNDLHRSP